MQEAAKQRQKGNNLSDLFKDYMEGDRDVRNQTLFPTFDKLNALNRGEVQVEGLSPKALAALRAQAIDQTPAKYDQAFQQLKAKLGARGLYGGMGGSGNVAGMFSQLEIAKAQDLASQLRGITLTDEERRQQNKEFLLKSLLGTGQLAGQVYDPTKWIPGSVAALNSANQALGVQAGATGQRAGIIRKNWWDNYGPAIVGAGINLATGGIGGLVSGAFSGGGGGGGSMNPDVWNQGSYDYGGQWSPDPWNN